MAVSDAQRMLYQQYTDAASKLMYFLMGVTGAGIGFVVQKLDDQRFDVGGIFLLSAALSLLLSLAAGIAALTNENRARRSNYKYLEIRDASLGDDLYEDEATLKSMVDAQDNVDRHARSAWRFGRWQYGLLVFGILLLILWRVIEMANHGRNNMDGETTLTAPVPVLCQTHPHP